MSKRSTVNKTQKRAQKRRQRLLKVSARKNNKTQDVGKTESSEPTEVSLPELEAIIERAAKGPLNEEDRLMLLSVSQTLQLLTEQLEKKGVSIARLKKLLFGASTETQKNLDPDACDEDETKPQDDDDEDPLDDDDPTEPKKKPKGHGRNGSDAYKGAKKIQVSHETLKPGDPCPDCDKGTVYQTTKPGSIVRVTGQAPLKATVYELQKLRCNLCGKIFTAEAPAEARGPKYDAESASMIALLKYGSGVPFNRLKGLQGSLGMPLPASTQWDILSQCEAIFIPAHEQLILAAAQGQVLHNDDTGMKVLTLGGSSKSDVQGQRSSERTGVFTSGIVSIGGGHRIALFFTGHQHAGENLRDVLQRRAAALADPIQMCDALSRNMSEDFKAIVANCLVHGRRKFVDVVDNFPTECLYVIKLIGNVYKNDAVARDRQYSDVERLTHHQTQSGPLMEELKTWMTQQQDDKQVEPNSGLGEAIAYMLRHWEKLTLFLRHPGAPLDNNICERALKKAILHRKNAYFYKTANGARVGDMFMGLIHTCELNKANPFEYLTAVQKHADAVASCPADWMPWNYQQALCND